MKAAAAEDRDDGERTNALASPAALLPLAGAAVADAWSLEVVFGSAAVAAAVQLVLSARLGRPPDRERSAGTHR